jgi:hypothetical protein
MVSGLLSGTTAHGDAYTDEGRLGREFVYLVRRDGQVAGYPKDVAYGSLMRSADRLRSKWYHRDVSVAVIKKTVWIKVDANDKPNFSVKEDGHKITIGRQGNCVLPTPPLR